MGLFSRKDPDEERASKEAEASAAADLKAVKIKEIQDKAAYKVENAKLDAAARAERRAKYDDKYREARQEAAVSKAVAKAKADANTVGMSRGSKLLSSVGSAVGKLQGGPERPSRTVRTVEVVGGREVTTISRYQGGGGARGGGRSYIPAFQNAGVPGTAGQRAKPPVRRTKTILVQTGPNTYQERQVPLSASQQPRPRQTGLSIPALSGGAGTSPLSGFGMGTGGGKKGKRGATGIPFLDNN